MLKNIVGLGTALSKKQQKTILGGFGSSTKTCVTCSNGYEKCCTGDESPNVNCVTKTGKCEKTQIPNTGEGGGKPGGNQIE